MRLPARFDSKVRGEKTPCGIRPTSNTAVEDAATSEWCVYFDRDAKG
jgi:hypothetical protein